jgi:hypothetical protein
MGEARRRKEAPAGALAIEGPFSYEIGAYRLDDIFAGVLAMVLGVARPSEQARKIQRATEELARRMQEPSLPTMLCMTCDHEFARDERPTEIAVALPWANPEHPPIVSPICAACAAASQDAKIGRMQASWARFSPGMRFDEGPGRA